MDLPGEPSARPGGPGRRGRRRWLTLAVGTVALAVAATVAAVVWPTRPVGPAAGVGRLGSTGVGSGAGAAATAIPPARDGLAGSPAIGALFGATPGGRLLGHFCTASVIDSPRRDLLITAAHCVDGFSDARPVGLTFIPGFYHGKAPYGIWVVTRIFVDAVWAASADIDHDVAFLMVSKPGSRHEIQDVTGGERLGVGLSPNGTVRVIGYPGVSNQPISCQNRVSAFSASQMQFDCDSFTDGTSGSPLLIDVDAATGEGTVIGVIGGYQEGGDSPDVSYAATFGSAVQQLYNTAVGQS